MLSRARCIDPKGIDIEAEGKITDRWSVFGGLVLMQSKVTQSNIASNIGLQLANVAHQSFSRLTKYKFDGDWEVGGQAVYRCNVYGGTFAANTGNELPSYWRFDAFVEKKIDKNWTMKFYAQNLTNELYYDTLLPERGAVRRGRAGEGFLHRHDGQVLMKSGRAAIIAMHETVHRENEHRSSLERLQTRV